MTSAQITLDAERLGAEITRGSAASRQRLQPEFNRILIRLKAEGMKVPKHLRELDAVLLDEVIEAQFDNMPV